MTNPLLEEVYRAREKLWQRAGGTMRGLGEYLMEYRRRADARGVKWIESEEELEAIGAEVRARLAAEEKALRAVTSDERRVTSGGAECPMCVGEPKVEYQVEEGALRAVKSEKRKVKRGATGTPGHWDAGTGGQEEGGAGREGEGDGFAITDTHD